MITGDHKETAAAIASEIGIFTAGDLAVTGADLDQMSDQQLQERLEKISVYARVSPEHKIRIVEAWQKKGHITAMTGDGSCLKKGGHRDRYGKSRHRSFKGCRCHDLNR